MTKSKHLTLVLADQLSWQNPAMVDVSPETSELVFAEVKAEATYVRHNKHKIAFLFAAMRHFAEEAKSRGFTVHYFQYDAGIDSLFKAVARCLSKATYSEVRLCEPGEWRLREEIADWQSQLGLPVSVLEDTRFLASHADFATWADSQKTLRMEYFYRSMRKRYGLLMAESGKPIGDRWNYDAENRSGWRNKDAVPVRLDEAQDGITADVIHLVDEHFLDHPGDLTRFSYAVTAERASVHLTHFIQVFLPQFGQYQDALAEESTTLFHGLIGLYLNAGLLDPLDVCQRAETAYKAGHVSLAATEGFVRQILGWREYVRGIYWYHMPNYASNNTWGAKRPLPAWFWTAQTDMRCLHKALEQSLNDGYAHHIQRLMVIGNFALIAGLTVDEVCAWFLAVYVDAYEWVELPNTLGMALNADDGIMASKPYAASGKYIAKQGNHCQKCRFDPKLTTGERACPYNSLYWHFIDQNLERLSKNPRMGLITGQWKKRDPAERESIVSWAEQVLATQL